MRSTGIGEKRMGEERTDNTSNTGSIENIEEMWKRKRDCMGKEEKTRRLEEAARAGKKANVDCMKEIEKGEEKNGGENLRKK